MNKLTTAVWEITMGCNMRCKHCGSSCAEALPDELNTSEALEVCDQLKYLESLNDISEIDNVIEKAAALKHQDLYKIACEIKQSKL